jgi:hypothetical protein
MMSSSDTLISQVFNKRLAPFARHQLDELVEGYDDFEDAVLDAVTELCANYLIDHTSSVAGSVLILNNKPYHWNIAYNPQQRTLTIVILPEYESRAKHRFAERATIGIGRVFKVVLLYVNAVAPVFLPLLDECAHLVLRSHSLLESSLLGSVSQYRNRLLEGIDEIVKPWAQQNNINVAVLTYIFSVTGRDTVRFNYSLTADNIREMITRCNAAQPLGASPFELITALLTTEMQDAVISGSPGEIPQITVVPYVALKSMETHYEFWSGEHILLGGTALAAIDIGSCGNYVLQLNINVSAQHIGARLVEENRQLLLVRFKANVDFVTTRFGKVGRLVRRISKGAARESAIEFLSDLFWKIVHKGASGGA